MNWLYYLLEANLYLAVFYGFYRLLLHRETFYQLNRYYLLGTSMLAFLLPMFQISYLDSLLHPVQSQATVTIQYAGELLPAVVTAPALTAADAVFVCYMLVAAFFLFRLCTSLYKIFRLAARADKTYRDGIIEVHFSESDTAFSFFNLLFINPATEKQHIILKHEMIHIRQKHSLDILFFEMLLICNWFNPLCWLMKQDIKLIHEYIADEATTNQGLVKHDYAMFLIHNSFGPFPNMLTSQMFNQSILKNRISMLNKKRSAGRARLRLLYVLPLTGGMLCASTLGFTKDYAIVDLYAREKPAVSSVSLQEPKQEKLQEPKAEKRNSFTIESRYNPQTGNNSPIKLIVINGKISKAVNFDSVNNYDQVKELNSAEAVAKYGKQASKGALEFTGKNAGISIKFPPPRAEKKLKKNVNVKFPPPAPPKKQYKPGEVKFPPPSIKSMNQYDKKTAEELKLGPNPIYVNNGAVLQVPAGKKFRFEAQSVSIHPKNTDKLIERYGEQARDGVIELKDGKIIIE